MFYVYVLKNENDKIYIGYTSDLEKRIDRHNNLLPNKNKSYTSKNKKGDWKLVYKEEFRDRSEAIKREKQLKSYQGRLYIRKITLSS